MKVNMILSVMLITLLTGCFNPTPYIDDITYINDYIVWDEIDGATYKVSILDQDFYIDNSSVDVSYLMNGIYDVFIHIYQANDQYYQSFEVTIDRYYPKPQMIDHQGQTLTFEGHEDALSYEIWMNGYVIETKDTFVDLGPLSVNRLYHIQIRAIYKQEAGPWSASYLIDTHEDELDVITHVYDLLDDEDFNLDINPEHTLRVLNDSIDIKEESGFIKINKDDLHMLDSDSLYVIEDTGDTHIIHHIKIRDMNHSYLRSEQTLNINDELSVLFHLVEGAEITFYLGGTIIPYFYQNEMIILDIIEIERYLEINEVATISYVILEKHINIVGYLIVKQE